ncbi:MAG: histidine phosphatase family protein, partial [Ilumatobacteraceae bacterium]
VSRIHLVRHGRAAAGWDDDADPGLDAVGRSQAEVTARRLAQLDPTVLVSSPLRRCRETAGFLAAMWNDASVAIEPRVSEIPSPDGVPLGQRVPWLRAAMAGCWHDLGDRYTTFRDDVVNYVSSRPVDTVIFSHFIAINAVIGACLNDDRLVIDSLDNASVTVVEALPGGSLRLVERGEQANTLIR